MPVEHVADGVPVRPLFTAEEIAELLGIARRTFDRFTAEGAWPAADVRRGAKFVRWTRPAVIAGIHALTVGSSGGSR